MKHRINALLNAENKNSNKKTLTMASECSSKRKSHTSLTLNQKLEIIKLSEEALSKAEIHQKLGVFCQLASCECKRKVLKGNLKC